MPTSYAQVRHLLCTHALLCCTTCLLHGPPTPGRRPARGRAHALCCAAHAPRFDFLITLASFAEMVVELQPGPQEARFNGGLTAIRLLRLFRLARYWDGLNEILIILSHAFSSGIYLFGLVLLFMFVAGLLGMQVRRVRASCLCVCARARVCVCTCIHVCVSARVRACVYVSVRVRVLISCAASGPAVHVCCRAAGHAGAAVRLRARLTMGALLRTLIRFCLHVCVCLGQ